MTISEQSYDASSAHVARFAVERSPADFKPGGGPWCVGKLGPMSELAVEAGLLQKRALQLKEHL